MDALGLHQAVSSGKINYEVKTTSYSGQIATDTTARGYVTLVSGANALACSCLITSARNIFEYLGSNSTVGRPDLSYRLTIFAFIGLNSPFAYFGQSGFTNEFFSTDIYISIVDGNIIARRGNWSVSSIAMTISYVKLT